MKKVFVFMIVVGLGIWGYYYFVGRTSSSADQKVAVGARTGSTYINVDFDGEDFSPKSVEVPLGGYLVITNKSNNHAMTLVSTFSNFQPKGSAAFGESFVVNMDTSGRYLMINKDSPDKTLVVVAQ